MEIYHSQLKINHLSDTPSTKAAGGGIFSGVFIKDVAVPLQEAELVGTSSSNSDDVSKMIFQLDFLLPFT